MRSLFHFPLPCTTTLAVTVSYSNRPTAPEMSRRPHPAPMRRQRRSPVLHSAARPLPGPALTGPWPTVTRSQGARHAAPHPCLAPLPAPLGLRFRALLGLGFVPPPEPRPCVHCASIAYALLPAARVPLCRHRTDPESSSRPLSSGSPARIAPPSRPPRADIRVTPPSLSSRCGGPRALADKNRAVCIPFSPNARKRPPSWHHPAEMHAFRDQDGNILAPCIHFRVQSGDSGYMARESCRQGPFFASRSPKSCMARRCCQRRPAFPRQRHAVRPNGLCALRRGPGLLAACAPCHLACARRGLRPCHLARVHRRRLTRAALRRPRPATRSPYRCISLPARRTHPASRTDPPRPGNKRNNTNNSMRA